MALIFFVLPFIVGALVVSPEKQQDVQPEEDARVLATNSNERDPNQKNSIQLDMSEKGFIRKSFKQSATKPDGTEIEDKKAHEAGEDEEAKNDGKDDTKTELKDGSKKKEEKDKKRDEKGETDEDKETVDESVDREPEVEDTEQDEENGKKKDEKEVEVKKDEEPTEKLEPEEKDQSSFFFPNFSAPGNGKYAIMLWIFLSLLVSFTIFVLYETFKPQSVSNDPAHVLQ